MKKRQRKKNIKKFNDYFQAISRLVYDPKEKIVTVYEEFKDTDVFSLEITTKKEK